MKKNIAALALIACIAPAWAGAYYSGNEILSRMESSDPTKRLSAMMYVAGVVDTKDEEAFCIPPGVTIGQLADIVKAALQAIPERRHFSASAFVEVALARAFPCAKREQKLNSL